MKTRRIAGYRSLAFVAGVTMCLLSSTVLAQQPPSQPAPPSQPGSPQQSPQDQPADPGQFPQEPQQVPEGSQQPSAPTVREDYSDKELKSFVSANKKVADIQEETEQMIVDQIEEKGMTVDRFNQILEGQQNPVREDSVEASPEELAAFNEIAQSIVSENEKVRDRIEDSIEGEGINLDTYEAIMVAYQFSPKVQQRIHKLLEREEP